MISYSIRSLILAHNFGALDSLTNSITNMAEHLHEGWAVSWFRQNINFQHRFSLPLSDVVFFVGGGGGGGGGGLLKVLGKTERTGKFGKIALIIFFFSLIWIEFI